MPRTREFASAGGDLIEILGLRPKNITHNTVSCSSLAYSKL